MPSHDAATTAYLHRLYAEGNRAFACAAATPEQVATWAASARPALRELLGLERMHTELQGYCPSVSLLEAEDLGAYTRQAGVLHSEPGFEVPFWFLLPKGTGPHPIALFPHGHYAEHGLDYAVGLAASPAMAAKIASEDRDVAVQAVVRGFACIAPATRGFSPAGIRDVTRRHDGSHCRCHAVHAMLAGRTATAERVWDLEHLLDWAAARSDTDASTVLVMGNSGGGVVTLYTAACDTRVGIAVASCSFCSFVGAGGAVHHCDCNLVPGALRFGEFADIAGLIAPRRLFLVHGREDPLFPLEEVDRAVADVRRIYAAAGAPEAFGQAYGPAGHRFYGDLMWPVVETARSSITKAVKEH